MLLPSRQHTSSLCGVGIPIPIFFVSVILILLFYFTMSSHDQIPVPASPPRDFHFKYTVLKGYFMQSEDSTDDQTFDFKKSNFGLIESDLPDPKNTQPWTSFTQHIRHLNTECAANESIKVLWLGRHGQGWHNVAETKYGTKAWDCYYSALDGADGTTWADARLTPTGQQQARDVNTLWAQQLPRGIPVPETYYVSPLTRTVETADLTFNHLDLNKYGTPYAPYIKELLREALGVHTCDRRSTKSYIAKTFPHVTFEPGFSEKDVLWEADYREPSSARRYRLAQFLDDLFGEDPKVFLSLTSHSGAIGSILEVVGHRRFALETGGVIPVVVKAVRVEGEREVPEKEPSEGPPVCKEPPMEG